MRRTSPWTPKACSGARAFPAFRRWFLRPTRSARDRYDRRLLPAIEELRKRKLNPVFAWHGILGRAAAVLGSHYHALQSALVQGDPGVGVGADDTRGPLLRDFGWAHLLLPDPVDTPAFARVMEQICRPAQRVARHERIVAMARRLQERVNSLGELLERQLAARAFGRAGAGGVAAR